MRPSPGMAASISRRAVVALRHAPQSFGIELDPDGFAPLDDLYRALQGRYRKWPNVSCDELAEILRGDGSDRFEVHEGQVRALYGHSVRLRQTTCTPPALLFHGTAREFVDQILSSGLRPMFRANVQLTTERNYALRTRASSDPVVLRVDAKKAHAEGVSFFHLGGIVWMSDPLRGCYISIDSEQSEPARSVIRRLFVEQDDY